MLIAIMGDTFDAVLEYKHQFALKEKVQILADFVNIIEFLSRKDKIYKFIFAAEPTTKNDDEESSWEGKIGAIKKIMETSHKD